MVLTSIINRDYYEKESSHKTDEIISFYIKLTAIFALNKFQ